jgi:hypothetical protein
MVGGTIARAEYEADEDVDGESGSNNVPGARKRSALTGAGEGGEEGAGVRSGGASMAASLTLDVLLFPRRARVRAREWG